MLGQALYPVSLLGAGVFGMIPARLTFAKKAFCWSTDPVKNC